jgi:selenide, water dikinase
METEEIKLTTFSRGSGCGCKISPAILKNILKTNEDYPMPSNLLVGNADNDDAAVLELDNGQCLISTTDFFMPVVDNAYDYGRIASTNAISDVYAMGGTPILAVAILGWPVDKLPAELAAQVIEGARFTCRIAGIQLAGGHSVDSAEPFFGLAVNGVVSKQNLKRNNTANEGDLLFITKPLGLGLITTAHKRGVVLQQDYDTALSYMCTINKVGQVLGTLLGVSALTDVTGFGMVGHLLEMCDSKRLSAALDFNAIPLLPNLQYYLDKMIYPDMTMKNYAAYAADCTTLNAAQLFTLCDPQTSGGLMVAVSPNSVDAYLEVVRNFGLQGIADVCVGKLTAPAHKVVVVN